jgi:hypothetical protein
MWKNKKPSCNKWRHQRHPSRCHMTRRNPQTQRTHLLCRHGRRRRRSRGTLHGNRPHTTTQVKTGSHKVGVQLLRGGGHKLDKNEPAQKSSWYSFNVSQVDSCSQQEPKANDAMVRLQCIGCPSVKLSNRARGLLYRSTYSHESFLLTWTRIKIIKLGVISVTSSTSAEVTCQNGQPHSASYICTSVHAFATLRIHSQLQCTMSLGHQATKEV